MKITIEIDTEETTCLLNGNSVPMDWEDVSRTTDWPNTLGRIALFLEHYASAVPELVYDTDRCIFTILRKNLTFLLYHDPARENLGDKQTKSASETLALIEAMYADNEKLMDDDDTYHAISGKILALVAKNVHDWWI